ncbi:hypothetical protein [Parasphingorhabdus sp.]|uniref:hypothetical protein n=1 Tax=Parasphingorhabdus sp. TaxID=2709688 RepID=UPI0030B46F74
MKNMLKMAALPLVLVFLVGAVDEQPCLTFKGLGPAQIGMSETELKQLGFGDPYRPADWQTDEDYAACHFLIKEVEYPGVRFMINEDMLVRIGIHPNDAGIIWQTLSGATIGMTETEVASIYGNWMKIDDHPYLGDAGSYLVLASSDWRYQMIFETATPDGGGEQSCSLRPQGPVAKKRVTDFRAGLAEAVSYIEGRS